MVNAQKYIRMHFEIHSDERIISFECVRGFIRMKQSVHSNEFPKPFETHFQRLKHQFLIHNRSAHCLPKKEIKQHSNPNMTTSGNKASYNPLQKELAISNYSS
jgi:hypothetical protein